MILRPCFRRICLILTAASAFMLAGVAERTPLLFGAQASIGKIASLDQRKKEIIVRSTQLLQLGEKISVQVDGRKLTLNVTFPMQTVAKCSLSYEDRAYFGKLEKDMPVFRYVKETGKNEPDKKESASAAKHGEIRDFGGIKFVFIQGGEYMMGSTEGDGDPDETPTHKVSVDSFWMSTCEITQEQYESLMENNPSQFVNKKRPVENVEWYNAMDYCRRFSSKNGVNCRLPYEAEWEYACRAGTTSRYYWGDEFNGNYCWYADNTDDLIFGQQTQKVGSKNPNKWGLYDMLGNVFEWCMDIYSEKYYHESPAKNPHGPASGETRSMRGGCFSYQAYSLRPAVRGSNDPSRMFSRVGFRALIEAK